MLEGIHARIDDPRGVEPLTGMAIGPSPVPPAEGPHGEALRAAIDAVFTDPVVAPSLVVGATDGHSDDVAEAVCRFGPVRLTGSDLARLPGVDERISIEGFATAVAFDRELIVGASR